VSLFRLSLAMLAVAFGLCATAWAQDAQPLRVATRVVAPLVEKKDGQLTGFSIDLWNVIAAKLGKRSEFQEFPNVAGLLDAVHSHKADLGIAAVSITAERDKEFDFSQPIMNAGLQTLIRGKSQSGTSTPLEGLLRLLFSPIILVWLGIALLLIIIPAHLVWLLERNKPDGMIPEPSYIPGIFHALWWAAGTLATQADQMPKQWLARIVAALWMFTSVVFVAYYTAQLTASLTVEQIQGDIKGPDDLPGKKVATTKGSTAAEVLKSRGAVVKEFDTIEDAYAALDSKSVEAVVYDAPVLLFYSEHEGKGLVQPVGPIFHKEDYGILFDENSELRKQTDRALLSLREDGTYDQIYQKWFGGS
jgi:polar amino acid transport system substrate-binding protein